MASNLGHVKMWVMGAGPAGERSEPSQLNASAMKRNKTLYWISLSVSMVSLIGAVKTLSAPPSPGRVTLMRTPDGGIQPQAVVDRKGVLHLIYFKGDPTAGDIFYVRKNPGADRFSKPIQVNSQPGSAVAVGSVRGAQIAVGKGGRVHIAWMGSAKAEPPGPSDATPMLYARLNDQGTAFEPQRNVMEFAVGLDGGASVAADQRGHVYVVWHGRGDVPGEANRRVWMARSRDDGKTFSREVAAGAEPTGACGCCGMRAFVDGKGALYILYRAATESVHRDMVLLTSTNCGKTFRETRIHKWELNACPMSTVSISEGGTGVLAAWETEAQVYFAEVEPSELKILPPVPAPGEGGNRKHPAVAGNARGETLLAWEEGTAWKKGGSLAWQLFDRTGRPEGQQGHAGGVPVWGLATAFAEPGGEFTIVY